MAGESSDEDGGLKGRSRAVPLYFCARVALAGTCIINCTLTCPRRAFDVIVDRAFSTSFNAGGCSPLCPSFSSAKREMKARDWKEGDSGQPHFTRPRDAHNSLFGEQNKCCGRGCLGCGEGNMLPLDLIKASTWQT